MKIRRLLVTSTIVMSSYFFVPEAAYAQAWQCQMQIPTAGSINTWCGTNPVNLRISGRTGSGWIGTNPFSLWISGKQASGWIGQQPVSLWKSGSFVSGWVGQNPVSCRVTGRNNFCITFVVTDGR